MSLFDSMKGIQIPTTEAQRNELFITEGAKGFWNYHLSRRKEPLRGLCGAGTMPTALPVSAWGKAAEEGLPRSPTYCSKCAAIAWPQDESA